MRRTLILMRHGEAESGGAADHARHLTVSGRQRARQAGEAIRDKISQADLIIVSDAVRTRETYLEVRETLPAKRIEFEPLIYSANSSAELMNIITQHSREGDLALMVIGHNPVISGFASTLSGDFFAFSPADFAVFDTDAPDWTTAFEMTGHWTCRD